MSGGGWASTFVKVAGAVAAAAAVAANSSIMSGGSSNNGKDNKDEEEGWASMFLKVAGAVATAAAVAGSIYVHYQEEVTLRVDGSLKREKLSAGCGGYLSSPSQNWICGFVQKLKFTPNLKEHETEKEAILRGMRWVKKKGWWKVAVISDCKTVVDSVNSKAPSKDRLIDEIRDFIDSDEWDATLSWISRGQNGEADKLADKAHSCRSLELHQSNDRPYLLNLNNQIPHPWEREENMYQEEVILKVDGSLLRERLSAGCGGFLSSASEKWICGFAQKLNPNLREDETEREAILSGLLWVKEKGEKKVVVKTDNEGIENLVNSGRPSTDPVIRDIRNLLNSGQWKASLSWIRGSENAVADRLAHKAHSFTSDDLQEFDDPPQNCLHLL